MIIIFTLLMFYYYYNKMYYNFITLSYVFINYKSSNLEKEWLEYLKNNRNNYSSSYCKEYKKIRNRLEILSKNIVKCKSNNNSYCVGNDLSYFVYKDSKGNIIKEYIEPLFGILRNTYSICNSGLKGDIFSKDYLLPSYILSQHKPITYIDAGASTFNEGGGGASQNYFYNFYKKYKDVKYKAWFLWESAPQNMSAILEEIPEEIKKNYHYYNRPIVTKENDIDNPLVYIRGNQNKSYVIFKMDVDNPSVEIPIFNYLLTHNDIIPNEYYFEYHFNEPYMIMWWKELIDTSCNLYCATNKFLLLRKKGIRAHGWV